MTMVAVTNMPKASGANSLAKTIVDIGETNFAAISVKDDHFVAFTTFLFKSDITFNQ